MLTLHLPSLPCKEALFKSLGGFLLNCMQWFMCMLRAHPLALLRKLVCLMKVDAADYEFPPLHKSGARSFQGLSLSKSVLESLQNAHAHAAFEDPGRP